LIHQPLSRQVQPKSPSSPKFDLIDLQPRSALVDALDLLTRTREGSRGSTRALARFNSRFGRSTGRYPSRCCCTSAASHAYRCAQGAKSERAMSCPVMDEALSRSETSGSTACDPSSTAGSTRPGACQRGRTRVDDVHRIRSRAAVLSAGSVCAVWRRPTSWSTRWSTARAKPSTLNARETISSLCSRFPALAALVAALASVLAVLSDPIHGPALARAYALACFRTERSGGQCAVCDAPACCRSVLKASPEVSLAHAVQLISLTACSFVVFAWQTMGLSPTAVSAGTCRISRRSKPCSLRYDAIINPPVCQSNEFI